MRQQIIHSASTFRFLFAFCDSIWTILSLSNPKIIMHSALLNFIVRNQRKVAAVHEQYLCRQVLFCSLPQLRIASHCPRIFKPNNEDVSHSFLIGVRFVRDRTRTFLKQYDGKIATGIIRKQNVAQPNQINKKKTRITPYCI